MAVQYNDITAIGDVFIVKANAPIIGVQYISGYTDDVLNETVDRYFDREFRYSINGITYTDWIELTDANLQNEFINETDIFDIQYRYTRAGTDDTGFLTFNSISLLGVIVEVANPKIFTDLYFNKFFNYNDDSVLRWALNVLDKLYNRGIVANYVERGEITDEDDDDFLAFFGAITHFFAIIVRYAREFKDFTLNDVLLLEYLKQKNVFLCDDIDLAGLQNILSNLYNNFLERGTNQIVKTAGEDGKVVDGELLRLICKKDTDEFLFGLIEREKTIWNINNNSPLYKGTKGSINLIKAYESEQDVQDLTNYPLLEDFYITKYTDDTKDVIRVLNVAGTKVSGIGDAENQSKLILIDPRMNYEVTFYVKQAILGDYLHLKVNVYDEDFVLLTDCPISAINGSQTNLAIDKESLNRDDIYYFIRLLLFSQITECDPKYVLDIGFGNHLIINNPDAKYMSIELGSSIVSGGSYDGNNDLMIWDFKVSPAIENYANSFVMIPNIISSFMENNSEFTNQNIENKIKKFLLPYNTIFKNQFLDELFVSPDIPLQITITVKDETIIGAGNGSIIINAIGGTVPYVYSIDNGVTFFDTDTFENLSAGTYNIVVKDAKEITVTDMIIIEAGVSDLSVEAFTTPASKLDESDGEITVLASGGISPYYYSLDNINYQVSNNFTGLAVGDYTVYVKDSIDIVRSVEVTVGVIRDNLLTITVRDEKSVLVEGVSVRIFNNIGFEEIITTDINGEAEILLEDSGYNIEFTKSGYKTLLVNNLSVVSDRSYEAIIQTYYTLRVQHIIDPSSLIGPSSLIDEIVFSSFFTPIGQSNFTYNISIIDSNPVPLITVNNIIAGDYGFRSEGYYRGIPVADYTITNYTLINDDDLDIILET